MIKKLTIYTILFSMTAHCACRLGIVDHLYKKWHNIAYTLGLKSEIPISLCGSKHEPDKTFKTKEHGSTPISALVSKAQSINLFFHEAKLLVSSARILLNQDQPFDYTDRYALILVKSFFHPPSVIS